jgi:hypothetical protein
MSLSNGSTYSLNVHQYFEHLNRHKNFYGTAMMNRDGTTFRIHVFADHIANVDIVSTVSPMLDLMNEVNRWREAIEAWRPSR